MRIQLDGVVALLERGLVVAAVGVDHRQIARHDRRHRIERLREPHLVERFVETPHRHQARHRVPVMRGRVARVEPDGELELALRAVPVPVLRRLDVRQRGVGLGASCRRASPPRRRSTPPWPRRSAGCADAVVGQQAVGVRQSAVGQRELRVLDDRLLEEVQRLVQSLVGALIQVIAALQVQVARREVLRRPARAAAAGSASSSRGSSFWTTASATDSCAANTSSSADVDRLGPEVRALALSTRWTVTRSRSPDLRTPPVSSIATWPACSWPSPTARRAARLHGQHAQRFELGQAMNDLLRAGRRRSSRARAPAL